MEVVFGICFSEDTVKKHSISGEIFKTGWNRVKCFGVLFCFFWRSFPVITLVLKKMKAF